MLQKWSFYDTKVPQKQMTERRTKKELKEIPGQLRIGVDVDGIIADIHSPVRERILKELGFDIWSKQDSIGFTFDLWPEIQAISNGPQRVRNFFADPSLYENLRPVAGAISSLTILKQQEHQLWFITARAPHLKPVTLRWFAKNQLGWAISEQRLIFSDRASDKRADFKLQCCQQLGLNVFIDDHAPTIKVVSSPNMIQKILLPHRWNQAEDVGKQAVFCQNWQEIFLLIQANSRWHKFCHQNSG